MCLIVHREAGTKAHLPFDYFDENCAYNGDGFGIGWREPKDGKLWYQRFGPNSWKDFGELLWELDDREDVEYVAHFRKGTSGPMDATMAHPFLYQDRKLGDTLVFHNGIISIAHDSKTESDTFAFVNRVLSKMDTGWQYSKRYRAVIEEFLYGDRMVIMNNRNTVRLNQDEWQKEDGIWYSTYPSIEKIWGGNGRYNGYDYDWEGYGLSGKMVTGSSVPSKPPYIDVTPVGKVPNKEVDEDGVPFDEVPESGEIVTENGHKIVVIRVSDPDPEGDRGGDAKCLTCMQDGDMLYIGGRVYFDIDHKEKIEDADLEAWIAEQEEAQTVRCDGKTPLVHVSSGSERCVVCGGSLPSVAPEPKLLGEGRSETAA